MLEETEACGERSVEDHVVTRAQQADMRALGLQENPVFSCAVCGCRVKSLGFKDEKVLSGCRAIGSLHLLSPRPSKGRLIFLQERPLHACA